MSRTMQTNVRLSNFSRQQLNTLVRLTGKSERGVIELALDRLYMSDEMYSQIASPFAEMAQPQPPDQE